MPSPARNAMKKGKKPKPRPQPLVPDDAQPVRYPVRAFVQTWGELANWWTHYDVDVLAAELTDEQFENFLATAEGTTRFADDLHTARDRHRRAATPARPLTTGTGGGCAPARHEPCTH